jgi:hypothetical protein
VRIHTGVFGIQTRVSIERCWKNCGYKKEGIFEKADSEEWANFLE